MSPQGFALFDTPIGTCGVAWNKNGIAGMQLPAATADKTRAHVRRRWPGAVELPPPPGVQRVLESVLKLLGGEKTDLSDIPLDLEDQPEFKRRVYEVARAIPPGQTMTYGEIARRVGVGPEMARDVGQAMGSNPVPIVIPCHRVLAASGKMGGFSAPQGLATKRRMLEIEGAAATSAGPLFANG
jgi:methylated-DNA-[protein]-cysteine S-methyltransferase